MKKGKRRPEKKPAPVAAPPRGLQPWHVLAAALGALFLLYAVYEPALRGAFLFDDVYLPFFERKWEHLNLRGLMSGVRPLLMLSFWLNSWLSGQQPYSYHLLNLLMHLVTGGMCILIVRRLLERAGVSGFRREAIAAFSGLLFLLHPVQTESVAYVAGRSDALSVMFFLGALAVFLCRRREAVSWPVGFLVLALFAGAFTTKENAAVLPLLLLLTDYYWNPGFSFQGIRKNWRLYALFAVGSAVAFRMAWRVLRTADTAGFSYKEFTWYQYFLTQCRAIWYYVRLFLAPYGQNVDPDFAISRTLLDPGALIGLLALVAAAIAAFHYRRRYPLASYGYFTFLLLLAPTSSFIPIADPVAERRLYLPFIGLLLIVAEFLRRWKASRAALVGALAAVLAVAAGLTYSRNQVWGSGEALWLDTVAKSPRKSRPHFQLGFVYYGQGRCDLALSEFETAARYAAPDYRLLIDWAAAYGCVGNPEQALAKLRWAAALRQTAQVYSLIGLVHSKQGRRTEALEALATAAALGPRFYATYVYRGDLYAQAGEWEAAAADYRRALSIDPENQAAQQGLALVEQRLGGGRQP